MASTPYSSTPNTDDPFAGGVKTQSLSWRGLPIGSEFRLTVLEPAKLLHSRDFETNLPAYWDEERQQPKMSAVLNVRVVTGPHSVGEERSIWALKPSNLFAAIAEAQKAAGVQIAAGGTLRLLFAGEIPHENKRYSPIKQYQARYEPPTRSDAFSPPPAQPAPQPPPRPGYQWPQATPTATSASPGTPTPTPSKVRW